MKTYRSINAFVTGSIWPILPEKMDAILDFLELKAAGHLVDSEGVPVAASIAERRKEATASVQRNVAVLPVVGVLSQRMSLMSDISGGTSTERLGREFDALVANGSVDAIVLDVDSPGGNYAGTPELAAKIYAARGSKPIVAVANSMAASAAYWIASAADELVVTPSGEAGGHGVLAVHTDWSEANEKIGIKPTYITYGKYKAEGNPDEPLADEALVDLQRRVNEAGEHFTRDLARQRGTSPQAVREEFGQGRMFSAKEAVQRGMADRVGTLEAEVDHLATAQRLRRGRRTQSQRRRLDLV